MTRVRMHADEIDFDPSLIAKRFPGLPLREVEPAGTDNRLFRIGDELVARVPVHERSAEALRREVRWLPVLGPALPVRVPEPVELVEPAEGFPLPWAVYRWLEGEQARGCTPEELAELLRGLWLLDGTNGPEPGRENAGRGVPLARRDTEAVRTAVAAVGMLDLWEEALAGPAWSEPPRWLHGDLDARNLLAQDGRLEAVLDWGCVGVGDPACDVASAWKLLDADGRARFRRLLDIDDATWQRARGWVVSQAAMAATYYTVETNATLLRESERWLCEVLD